jgi:two-component sensor histidine kinase
LVSENEDYYDSGHARVMTELASFVGIALHVQQTEAKLHRALEQQQTLAREMNHRVNNLFAVADGMIRVSARASSTPAEMAEALSGRLHALSVAHNLVRRSIDDEVITQSTALENIVRTIMSPHQTPSGALNRFSVSGPQINLGDRSTNGFAMVLHELATNAAKYGALASDDGIVAITWMEKNAELVMQWQESGGPQIDETPQKKGFGSILSQNVIVSQLSGTIDYDWRSAGLSVDIKVPIKSLIA